MTRHPRRSLLGLVTATGVIATSLVAGAPAQAADPGAPDITKLLHGYDQLWTPSGKNDLHGTVVNARALQHDDMLTSWINQNATKAQQFRAMQNSAYTNADGSGYDQSISIAEGFGATLGRIYAEGRMTGKLPLTTALVSSEVGSMGAYVGTSAAKKMYSHPRPYLQVDPSAPAVEGDTPECAPSSVNGSSVAATRKGKPWADAAGNLKITRVPKVTDTTHAFATTDVELDADYGEAGICKGGSFPSGHTTTAYQAGLTLATLVPQLAPSMLARTSEAGNNRIVLGVHYPLDIMGGRMSGEAAVAARWSDPAFRTTVIEPARKELVDYLTAQCTAKMHVNSLQACIKADKPYFDNPYGGAAAPWGTPQVVTNRASAIRVYTERLTYGFAPMGSTRQAPVVPAGAGNLLLTTFPTLTDAQREQVLAQTEIASGNPLAVGDGAGWQRLNLAAATSATVKIGANGTARVIAIGGAAKVITNAPTPSSTSTAPTSTPTGSAPVPTKTVAPVSTIGSSSTSTQVPGATSVPSSQVVQTDRLRTDGVLAGGLLGGSGVLALAGGGIVARRRPTH